jgi:adenylate cyclase
MADAQPDRVAEFGREGLLDDLTGEERDARIDLLVQLTEAGVSIDELRRAVAEDRLAMLPIELVFTGGCKYTLRDALEATGLDEDFVRRDLLALGFSYPGEDDVLYSEEDIESFKAVKQVLDAGMSEERFLELARIAGRSAAQSSDAVLFAFVREFLQAGDTERDVGLRLASLAEALMPSLDQLMVTPTRLHMREIVRREVIGRTERREGVLPGSREVGVCFADLVSFTSLTERTGDEGIGDVTARLELHASEIAEPPVRLIKLIGDAAMLVSPEVPSLIVGEVDRYDSLPQIRAGVAAGPALNRGGDWYGRSVNLASRLTGTADPGAIVATQEVLPRPGRATRGSRFRRAN